MLQPGPIFLCYLIDYLHISLLSEMHPKPCIAIAMGILITVCIAEEII